MASTAFVLKEVQVKGSRITGRDTISFDLTRFANERDNSLKDVLKKLPGVDIEKNGRINYNGKPINRFTVEGLDLTDGKYNQLEENIKAKDVKKAEVIEHDQPIKALQNNMSCSTFDMSVTCSFIGIKVQKISHIRKKYRHFILSFYRSFCCIFQSRIKVQGYR